MSGVCALCGSVLDIGCGFCSHESAVVCMCVVDPGFVCACVVGKTWLLFFCVVRVVLIFCSLHTILLSPGAVWLGVLSRGSACVCYGGMKVVLDGGTRVLFCAVGFVRSLCCVM